MKLKVVKSIFVDGKSKKVGEIIDLPDPIANEMIYLGKCVKIGKEPVTVPEETPKAKSKK